MYRFLLSRQWVILTLIGLVLMPVMYELGLWQYHRHVHKVAQNALIAGNLNADPVPVGKLTSPGHEVPRSDFWRRVEATGTWDTAHETVVRRRTDADDKVGFHVLTPLRLDDGRYLLVNRGWVDSPARQTDFPKVPPPPSGTVTVTGRLMADETTASTGIKDLGGLPDRQVMLINGAQQAKLIGVGQDRLLGGYLEQSGPVTKSPEQIPPPDSSGIGPHMAYAVQWWLFVAAVPVGWVILVRRELRDRAAAAARPAADDDRAEVPV
ncbi:SURF1 family protein [Streptomyces sp. NPDC060194]|uniref:SURF1 family cytochrome oxidase biogenesis protein n=1 Tax=Streptomyces sp. NPDC060194 TaxID=3347069 RepID=UPI00366734E8